MISEKTNYTPAEVEKLNGHIREVLDFVDPAAIGETYRQALAKDDTAAAVAALAAYYRARPAFAIAGFNAASNGNGYDAANAKNGVAGKMREINVDYAFPNGKINFLFNPTIENPPVNHEWLWQLNRHSWWVNMAQAYAATKDEAYAQAFNTQLLDWAVQTEAGDRWNAPGSAWRTIECGIRLMGSWHTAFNLFRASENVWDETLVIMLGSMHRQACHLHAHPTRGNWLLMETSGIYNFGALYPEFTDAEQLRCDACAWMIREINGQVLPDGMQFELSPDYHVVSLNCVLNLYRTAMATGKTDEITDDYRMTMHRMAMAAVKMSTPGFTQPRTNDCYTILTPRYTNFLATVFPEDPVFAFVNSVREEGAPPQGETASVFMPWSGFAVMRSDWTADASYLCFDVGPLGTGHWHQDKLNINLYKGGEELVFDDGGGQYEISAERTYGLSGYDHNTVTVDGLAQNRPGPKKSEAAIDAGWITNDAFDYAFGVYDDTFGEGEKPATHKREVRFCKPDFFVVRDTLTSADGGDHVYGLRFHLDTLQTKKLENGAVFAEYGKNWDLLVVPVAAESEFIAHTAEKDPLLGWYIGRNEASNHPATTIVMESKPCKEYNFTTVFIPVRHGAELPTVETADGTITVRVNGETYSVNPSELNQ